jgi:hypothetical protein
MSQPRDDRQDDLFRPSLEKIINLRHRWCVCGRDRLGLLGGTFQFGLSPRTGAATVADTIGSRTVHPQAHAQSL